MVPILIIALIPALHSGSRVGFRGSRAHVQCHGGMGGGPAVEATGFVQTEMRKAAMVLHTREQAPKEGQAPAPKMAKWEPTSKGYLQFLVDSRNVYATMEAIVGEREELASLRRTGLERTVALDQDIAWFVSDGGCAPTTPSAASVDYAAALRGFSTPAFVCHFYNYYFAHTAGGRMIGKQLSDALLGGRVLEFYKWDGDVKELLDATRKQIDIMAEAWAQPQRDDCLAQTAASFKGGGGLMASLRS